MRRRRIRQHREVAFRAQGKPTPSVASYRGFSSQRPAASRSDCLQLTKGEGRWRHQVARQCSFPKGGAVSDGVRKRMFPTGNATGTCNRETRFRNAETRGTESRQATSASRPLREPQLTGSRGGVRFRPTG